MMMAPTIYKIIEARPHVVAHNAAKPRQAISRRYFGAAHEAEYQPQRNNGAAMQRSRVIAMR